MHSTESTDEVTSKRGKASVRLGVFSDFAARLAAAVLVGTLVGALPGVAKAAQFIDTRDGDTALAKMSLKDQTRIKLERGRITDVIGDVYSKDKNPTGRIVVIADEEDGEIYVRPIDASDRPIKVDLRTDRGKFSLLLQPVDIPGDTLILRGRGPAVPAGGGSTYQVAELATASVVAPAVPNTQSVGAPLPRNANHIRALKAMTLAMACTTCTEVPADVEIRQVNQLITLWREARFVQIATFLSRDLVGESYELTNVSGAEMVIDERELYRDGVQAVSVQVHQLAPGAKTAVWIVRGRAANE